MPKKILVSLMCVFILTFTNLMSYQKVKANSFADIPGYADEMFQAVMIGVMTTGTAAIHAGQYVEDNLVKLKDIAVETWNTATPVMKQAFIDSLNAAGDRIVIAADWINAFFNTAKDSGIDQGIKYPADSLATYATGYIELQNKYQLQISFNAVNGGKYNRSLSRVPVIYSYNSSYATIEFAGYQARSYQVEAVHSSFKHLQNNPSVAGLIGFLGLFSISAGLLSPDGTIINDSIYNQAENWIRDRANNGKLTLGVPKAVPYSNTGRPLTLGTTGLTLDGVPYSGPITWGYTGSVGGLTDAGVIVYPDIMVNGRPAISVPIKGTNNPTYVDRETGQIVDTSVPGNITTIPNEFVWIDGIPYIKTASGTLINVITGEIVGDIPINPPIEGIKPIVPPAGDFAAPSVALDFSPLMMSGQLLTTKFPFSIPFDFVKQLKVFAVAPEAPKFEIDINNFFSVDGKQQSMNWTLDLTQFDKMAGMIRWFLLIAFDIAVILAIRRLMPE